ncbi:hypothetical protein [Muricoccus radiodurans]|uniref:hypothetical protein n=1 Tax=Muricoccus radiodurans TaxID=2231721 RepID=UPI003CF12A7D
MVRGPGRLVGLGGGLDSGLGRGRAAARATILAGRRAALRRRRDARALDRGGNAGALAARPTPRSAAARRR